MRRRFGAFGLAAMLLLTATSVAHAQQPAPRIAYAGEDGNIWLVRADGSDKQQVTTSGTTERGFHAPQWSPDGAMLAFDGDVGESRDNIKYGIFIVRDGQVGQLANIRQCSNPFFMDGGASVAFSCNQQFDGVVSEQQFQDPAYGALSASGLDGSNWHVVVPFAVSTALDPTGGILHVGHVSISPRDGSMLFNEPLQDGITSRALVPREWWPGGVLAGWRFGRFSERRDVYTGWQRGRRALPLPGSGPRSARRLSN